MEQKAKRKIKQTSTSSTSMTESTCQAAASRPEGLERALLVRVHQGSQGPGDSWLLLLVVVVVDQIAILVALGVALCFVILLVWWFCCSLTAISDLRVLVGGQRMGLSSELSWWPADHARGSRGPCPPAGSLAKLRLTRPVFLLFSDCFLGVLLRKADRVRCSLRDERLGRRSRGDHVKM